MEFEDNRVLGQTFESNYKVVIDIINMNFRSWSAVNMDFEILRGDKKSNVLPKLLYLFSNLSFRLFQNHKSDNGKLIAGYNNVLYIKSVKHYTRI